MEPVNPIDIGPPGELPAKSVFRKGKSLRSAFRRNPSGLSGPGLLKKILAMSLIPAEDWGDLSAETRETIERCAESLPLLELLVTEGLLTEYQASRLSIGKTFG